MATPHLRPVGFCKWSMLSGVITVRRSLWIPCTHCSSFTLLSVVRKLRSASLPSAVFSSLPCHLPEHQPYAKHCSYARPIPSRLTLMPTAKQLPWLPTLYRRGGRDSERSFSSSLESATGTFLTALVPWQPMLKPTVSGPSSNPLRLFPSLSIPQTCPNKVHT